MLEKNVEIIITTKDRAHSLIRLLKSIRDFYPKIDIKIANQGERFRFIDKVFTVYNIGDVGLSESRNYLVKKASKPYVLLLEDDFYFTKNTRIETLLKIAKRFDGDIVGGGVKEGNQYINFEFYPEIKDRILYQRWDEDRYKTTPFSIHQKMVKYKKTGSVINFALFNKEILKENLWDASQYLAEHHDFYLRLENKRILYAPEIWIATDKKLSPLEYLEEKRERRDYYIKKFMDKWELDKIIYINKSEIKYDREKDKLIRGKNL